MADARPDSTQTFRVGRLLVDLPASAQYTPATNGGTYNFAPIEEIPWPTDLPEEGRARDEAREALWSARRADAERLAERERRTARNNRTATDQIVVTDQAVDAGGAAWARALSWPTSDGTQVRIVVAVDAGAVVVVSQDKVSASRAAPALARTADALGGYVPAGAPGYGSPDGLYLRYGVVARPPALYEGSLAREGASAGFDGVPPFTDWVPPYEEGLLVSMNTRLRAPEGPSLLGRWRETQGIGLTRLFRDLVSPSSRPEAREVRAGAKAAGTPSTGVLRGEEVVSEFRMDAASGPGERMTGGSLHFEWEHIGTPGDGSDPDVTVSATTPTGAPPSDVETAEALAAWDAVLASLRLARPSPQP